MKYNQITKAILFGSLVSLTLAGCGGSSDSKTAKNDPTPPDSKIVNTTGNTPDAGVTGAGEGSGADKGGKGGNTDNGGKGGNTDNGGKGGDTDKGGKGGDTDKGGKGGDTEPKPNPPVPQLVSFANIESLLTTQASLLQKGLVNYIVARTDQEKTTAERNVKDIFMGLAENAFTQATVSSNLKIELSVKNLSAQLDPLLNTIYTLDGSLDKQQQALVKFEKYLAQVFAGAKTSEKAKFSQYKDDLSLVLDDALFGPDTGYIARIFKPTLEAYNISEEDKLSGMQAPDAKLQKQNALRQVFVDGPSLEKAEGEQNDQSSSGKVRYQQALAEYLMQVFPAAAQKTLAQMKEDKDPLLEKVQAKDADDTTKDEDKVIHALEEAQKVGNSAVKLVQYLKARRTTQIGFNMNNLVTFEKTLSTEALKGKLLCKEQISAFATDVAKVIAGEKLPKKEDDKGNDNASGDQSGESGE